MKTTLSILLLCLFAFSQTIIPDSNYTGKKWLLFGWYKAQYQPVDAYCSSMYFDSNWYVTEPIYHMLSTPDLTFWPPIDSCNYNGYANWFFSLSGLENKKIFLEGKYDSVCGSHRFGFQTISIDSIYQDSSTLLRLLDTLNTGEYTQCLSAHIFVSGRLTGTYYQIPSKDTIHFDSIITGLETNKLLACLNRNGYWDMESFVANPEWNSPAFPRHSNLYCKGKSCDLLLTGDSSSFEAEKMLNQLVTLLTVAMTKVSIERISSFSPCFKLTTVPNPSNGHIRIKLSLPGNDNALLSILDIRGRVIKKLWQGKGSINLSWQLDDEHGSIVSPGLYLCQLRLGSISHETKIVLLNR